MGKKKTANQIEWERNVSRIRNFINRAEKRGYQIDRSIIPEKPERITKKALEEIKGLTAPKLYKEATYKTPEGKTITGYEAREAERRKSAEKAQETRKRNAAAADVILQNVRSHIDFATGPQGYETRTQQRKNIINAGLNRSIATKGKISVARSLEDNAEMINHLIDEMIYVSRQDDFNAALESFIDALNIDMFTVEEYAALTAVDVYGESYAV